MTAKGFYDKIKKLDVDDVIETSMEEASPLITVMQKKQMLEGKNKQGKTIGRYRSPSYAKLKNAMNPIPGLGIPDLKLTGQFHSQIFTEIRGDKVIIDSADPKTVDLAKKYSEDIFGLQESAKSELIEKDLRPVFMKNIKKATGL